MISALVALLPAVAFLALGRWGLRNLEALVPVSATPERRAKYERSFRRGARSCLALGAVFGAFAVVLTIGSIAGTD